MAKTEEKTAWRFYRSNLSTIVWDPAKDGVMADFRLGHFTTNDPVVAGKLRKLGYVEIPLDATEPPDVEVNPEVDPVVAENLKNIAQNTQGEIKIKQVLPKPPEVKEDKKPKTQEKTITKAKPKAKSSLPRRKGK